MTADYSFVKSIHVGAAALSFALFALRGAWMLRAPELLAGRWVRVVPHVVDTALLASALWLASQLGADGTRGWLASKIVALVLYIALGTVALKRGRTRKVRILAFVAALLTFGYIVSVALTKSPLGVFARHLDVRFTPTLLLPDVKGDIAARFDDYRPPHRFAPVGMTLAKIRPASVRGIE